MRVYIAGLYGSGFQRDEEVYGRLSPAERRHRDGVACYLESFYFLNEVRLRRMRRDGVRIFLDSGAYSAHTQGARISLDAYCRFIEQNGDLLVQEDGWPVYAVLDAIGDAEATWWNQCAMEERGLRPMPCFHYGEDERYLLRYLDRHPYIALGGMVGVRRPQLEVWLSRIWRTYLLPRSGLKVHGFGLTAPDHLRRYPWHSVDSTAWLQAGSCGEVFLPAAGRIEHTKCLSTYAQRVAQEQGFSIERLRLYYYSRWTFNLWAYQELGRSMSLEGIRNNPPGAPFPPLPTAGHHPYP